MSDQGSVVHCIIPTFNRVDRLKQCINYLNQQDYPRINIIVVNDGSTDGTSDYLKQLSMPNLVIINGDGNLWWGGSMYEGICYVLEHSSLEDYVLMLNDDIRIDGRFISSLVRASIDSNNAVVGGVQRCDQSGDNIGCGYRIDYIRMRYEAIKKDDVPMVDAFSGRGVLFPSRVIRTIGNINKAIFPHYYGDIEYSARASEQGFSLVVCPRADVFTSSQSSDESVKKNSLLLRYFSPRSKDNLIHRMLFFSIRGPVWLRFWVLPRYALFSLLKIIGCR